MLAHRHTAVLPQCVDRLTDSAVDAVAVIFRHVFVDIVDVMDQLTREHAVFQLRLLHDDEQIILRIGARHIRRRRRKRQIRRAVRRTIVRHALQKSAFPGVWISCQRQHNA